MDQFGIDHVVNLSGGSPGAGLEIQLAAAARAGGRISVFCNLDWRQARVPGYGPRMAAPLETCKRLGALGLKVPKGLGLGYVGPDGRLLPVDDHGLDPVWRRAGELGLPVAIHIGDPKAFWLPVDDRNERIDELRVHPEWSNYGQPVPSWENLYAAFERLVARHRKTTFIGVHFGNDPEDPRRVAAMLGRYPNFYVDTAARIPEIGRQPAAEMRALFVRFQDRILFGTDLGVGEDPEDLMLGSTGATPPSESDVRRFFAATWRYFETEDRQFPHPTPIQGRWAIDGIGLPQGVLEKVYWRNASRLLGIVPRRELP
jgi:predicted TIM-barrel fold metal-dependent hydrolase